MRSDDRNWGALSNGRSGEGDRLLLAEPDITGADGIDRVWVECVRTFVVDRQRIQTECAVALRGNQIIDRQRLVSSEISMMRHLTRSA